VYFDSLDNAKKEILMVTSSKRLNEISKNTDSIKEWCKRGVSTKIMAPITTENLQATQKLLSCSEVRHIPVGYRETTIIDDKELFQFNTPCPSGVDDCEILNLENVFFTNNQDYIRQTKNNLFEIWEKTRKPSNVILESIIRPSKSKTQNRSIESIHPALRKLGTYSFFEHGAIPQKEVLEKYYKLTEYPVSENDEGLDRIVRYFGTVAIAYINLPESFNIPKFIIAIWAVNDRSSFGKQNFITIYLESKTKTGFTYIPVKSTQNSCRGLKTRKSFYKGSPAAQNISSVNENQIQTRMVGNTLFIGWTMPIQITAECSLPPSSILFEGFGKTKSGKFTTTSPSGRKMEVYHNTKEAFVNYYHPKSKISFPGSEGSIDTKMVLTYF
jgi:hypothetical protein